ncbi:MAG: S8 family serine peptidase, partial [Trueperaceae bacterium]|nr:S8 family serine peptidase [Trueperaceae bacterium]
MTARTRRRPPRARRFRAALAALVLWGAAGADPAPGPAALDAAVAAGGTTLVHVTLDVPARPEGRLGTATLRTQRTTIRTAQTALLADLPAGQAVVHRLATTPGVTLRVDAAGLAALRADPRVARVAPDVRLEAFLPRSVPAIHAPDAWADRSDGAPGFDGTGTAIAVLDDGADDDHPHFDGKTVTEACFSGAGDPAASLCPDGTTEQHGDGASVPQSGHGTHVAGTALSGDGTYRGVAPDADLVDVQVFTSSSDGLFASGADLTAALDYLNANAATLNLASVNLSVGAGLYVAACDDELPNATAVIESLVSQGVAVVAASGNDGVTNALAWPACIGAATSVGATGDGGDGGPLDEVAWFSNGASFLDLLAPGVPITAAYQGDVATLAGTSMATPHVAGAFAVLRDRDATASVEAHASALATHGVPVLDDRFGANRSHPRLDLAYLAPTPPDGPDLAFDGPVDVTPLPSLAGDAVEACFAWTNRGDAPVEVGSGLVVARAWFDGLDDPSAVVTSDADLTLTTDLAPGAGGSHCVVVTPSVSDGSHVVDVRLDPDDAASETDEANDARTTFTAALHPAQDAFADAATFPARAAGVEGRSRNATAEPGEPPHAGAPAAASIWWTWTPERSGVVTFDATRSAFPARVAAYRGDAVDALTPVASASDADAGARTTFLAGAGATYHLAVDGVDGATGDVELLRSHVAPTCPADASDLRPLGDVDADGVVTAADALRILRMADGSWPPPSDALDLRHADPSADGVVTDADVDAALAKVVGR